MFVDGLRVFKPRAGAPEYVKANLLLKKEELVKWLEGVDKEVRIDLMESKEGKYYMKVNNYTPKDDVPF